MAKLLSGKEVTASLNEEIRKKTELLTAHHITPKLGIIRIGEREDDISYERGAAKRCRHSALPTKSFCSRKMPQKRMFSIPSHR